ncbi:MAG: outer membrane lipoprotein chaperone LolA [Pseudomonadota bacterium]
MNRSFRPVRWIISLILLSSASFSFAETPSRDLMQRLESIGTMTADFNQLVMDGDGQQMREIAGRLKISRPGAFNWKTNDPFPQTIVSDGQTLWIYDEDLEQVIVKQVDESLQESPAILISGGVKDVEARFSVQRLMLPNGMVRFELTPKQAAENSANISSGESLVKLALEFSNQGLQTMQFQDALDQLTLVELMNVQLNPPLEPKWFSFKIPEGADVIDERVDPAATITPSN